MTLVGFFYLVRRGSLAQLLAATTLAVLFLLTQAVAQPFRKRSDNALAIACDACLLVMFMFSSALRTQSMADELAPRERLTRRVADEFHIDSFDFAVGMHIGFLQ